MNKNFKSNLPKRFTQNTLALCGEKGLRWLDDLPQIIEEIEKNWSLKAKKHFSNLSYNYVAPCICANGNEAVLKIGLPEEKIIEAVRILFSYANLKTEPTGALSLGAILDTREKFIDKKVCFVVSGGNVDAGIYRQILAD